jgi:actin-related protein
VEKTGIDSVFLSRKASLTLYSCGKTSGVVFKSGGFETQVASVEEGYVRQEGCVEGVSGGVSLTKAIAREMSQLGVYSSENQSWNNWMTLQLAEKCKKQLLKLEDNEGSMQEEFNLPDGSSFTLSDEVNKLNKYPFSDVRIDVSLS